MKTEHIKDFTRANICIPLTMVALTGYTIFNTGIQDLLLVAVSSLLLCVGGYSLNNIVDLKEDEINRGENPLAKNNTGKTICVFSFTTGYMITTQISPTSQATYLILCAVNVAYSLGGVKKQSWLKNLFTGFGAASIFIYGAAVEELTYQILQNYVAVALTITVGSMISDLRDERGDRLSGVNTLAVKLGETRARKVTTATAALTTTYMILAHTVRLYPTIPFLALAAYYMSSRDYGTSHLSTRASLITTYIWNQTVI